MTFRFRAAWSILSGHAPHVHVPDEVALRLPRFTGLAAGPPPVAATDTAFRLAGLRMRA